jgi:phosphatidylserine/phosphatidylglycerophosphate/cardiolipin synthase-like enzyme
MQMKKLDICARSIFIASSFFWTCATATSRESLNDAVTDSPNLKAVTKHFKDAQFISNNAEALRLRLALLDNSRPGARVRVATFLYEYGESVQTLAGHMCSAVARGVSVELLVDSKSGGIKGEENPYNGKTEIKQAEESLMNLANCGVKVFLHNYTTDYINFINTRLPNVMAPEARSGEDISLSELDNRMEEIQSRLTARIDSSLANKGGIVSIQSLINQTRNLIIDIGAFTSLPFLSGLAEDRIRENYHSILNNEFWDQFTPGKSKENKEKMRVIRDAFIAALKDDPLLKLVREKIRIFNRLNHRKLFIVEDSSRFGDDCVIIGGRNLGDKYLTDGAGSFRDGDVFFCRSQVPSMEVFLRQANESFEELIPGPRQDLSDPILSNPNSNVLVQIQPQNPTKGQVLPIVSIAGLESESIGRIESPILLTSRWNPATDEIHRELLAAIRRERREIYIETPYAQFDKDVRDSLEAAMRQRKVKVKIITNSLFISDGASRLIRLWMAKWNEEMVEKYPRLFHLGYVSLSSGHMIHFKGAAFLCQGPKAGPGSFREYIVGSHNFHPRSGYSDKEHAIEWRVKTNRCSNVNDDLVTSRTKYYRNAKNERDPGEPVVMNYTTLIDEISQIARDTRDPENSRMAQALEHTLSEEGVGKTQISDTEKLDLIHELLDQGGLRDMIGILL